MYRCEVTLFFPHLFYIIYFFSYIYILLLFLSGCSWAAFSAWELVRLFGRFSVSESLLVALRLLSLSSARGISAIVVSLIDMVDVLRLSLDC